MGISLVQRDAHFFCEIARVKVAMNGVAWGQAPLLSCLNSTYLWRHLSMASLIDGSPICGIVEWERVLFK